VLRCGDALPMSTDMDENNDELRKRISDLEGQLVSASSIDAAHQQVERGLRKALAYAQSLVDTVREPMLVLDRELRVQTSSRAFHETFRVSREATEGQLIYDLGDGQWNIPKLRSLLEGVLRDNATFHDYEVSHDFPGLGPRVMLLNARKLWTERNNTELLLLAVEDVTERKRLHDELVVSNEDLQRFAYVAAHDLRSPLNSALNVTQLFARRVRARLSDDEDRMLGEAIAGLERLGALMQDLLAYGQAGSAPQQRKPLPLEEPVAVAVANLQHHIEASGATVTVGRLPTLLADRTQMVIVFQNLLSNAMKYRREEPPLIRIDAVEEAGAWKVSVSDNGEGFDPAYAERIFEPFRRLHGVTVPGSGIGLATCKRIIERLGGTIWAESVAGQGSIFHFTLPAAA
jgi:signal transduction histidine kinase